MLKKKLNLNNDKKSKYEEDSESETQSSHASSQTYQQSGKVKVITSSFFKVNNTSPPTLWKDFLMLEKKLIEKLLEINFKKPVNVIYNPIEYASDVHNKFLQKFLGNPFILFVGMNPGPWGMCQNGIPFGHSPAVRDWMKLTGDVQKPHNELSNRPVDGLQCTKSEQSGKRFWQLFIDICGEDPNVFFKNSFVYNACPLAFFDSSGRNITPTELKTDERRELQKICTNHLKEVLDLLSVKIVISIGSYTNKCVKDLFTDYYQNGEIKHINVPHPSPRSLNNTNWNEKAEKILRDNDILQYLQ